MDISFNCNQCGQQIVIDEAGVGLVTDCPKCGEPLTVPSQEPPRAEPSATKECPFCAETIKKKARVCRWCGKNLLPHIGTSRMLFGAGALLGILLLIVSTYELAIKRARVAHLESELQTMTSNAEAHELALVAVNATISSLSNELAAAKGQAGHLETETPAGEAIVTKPGLPARELVARKAHLTVAGVSRSGMAAFGVAESPFGTYDKKLIKAVQAHWYALIDHYGIYESADVVTVKFELLDDGQVQNVSSSDSSQSRILSLFCEKAIIESGPFDPLSNELRALIGKEPRQISFTFYY